jgi:hypothetical protein
MRALKRVARFLPSPAMVQLADNQGQPLGEGGFPGTAGRRLTLIATHGVPLSTGIAARVVDGNGLIVPFARGVIRVYNVTDLSTAAASNTPPPTSLDEYGALSAGWITGSAATAGADGVLNFTSFTIGWCGAAVTRFNAFVCPLASTAEAAARSPLVCTELVALVLYPNPWVVELRYRDPEDPHAVGAVAVAGSLLRPFRIELRTSCRTALRLLPSPGSLSQPGNVSSSSSPRNLAVGTVSLYGIGLGGAMERIVASDENTTYALFDAVRAVVLPGAEEVAASDVVPTSSITINASFTSGAASPRDLRASFLISVLIRPATSRVSLSAWIVPLLGPHRALYESLIASHEKTRATAAVTDGSSSSIENGLPVTTSPLFRPSEMQRLAVRDFSVEMNLIRKYEGAMFALIFNASVFASEVSVLASNTPSELYSQANGSLHCSAVFEVDEAPRGLTYGLTQRDFISGLDRFAIVTYGTDADGTATTAQQFAVPFIVGPLKSLSSTLAETLTCRLNPALFAKNYYPAPATLQLHVTGLDDQPIGTARRVISLLALLNPEIAYISVVIQVCDCSIDHGRPLDMALHPLQFPIGTDQLTRYFIGALVGNAIVILAVTALSYVIRLVLLRRSNGIDVPSVESGDLLPQARNQLIMKKERLTLWADKIFPHSFFVITTALYPGMSYAAFALLPHVLERTFVLMAWCIVGVLFNALYPLMVLRVATKLSPGFRELDIHSITNGWLWKILIPLGDYDSQHPDLIRYRHCYGQFRGHYRWLYVLLFLSWLSMSFFAARFVPCPQRFLLPLVVQVVFFFFFVARAPFITAYQNVVAVLSTMMMAIGVGFLFWDDMERRSTVFLSAWSITLCILSLIVTIVSAVFDTYQDRYVLGAARGHLDEEFLIIVENKERLARRTGYYDPTGKLRLDAARVGAEDNEFIDAEKEAAEATIDGFGFKVWDMQRADQAPASPFQADPPSPPSSPPRRRSKTRRMTQQNAAALLDEILNGAKVPPPPRPFDDWNDTMDARERMEAADEASRYLKTGRTGRVGSLARPAKKLSPEDVWLASLTPEQRQRVEDERTDRHIDAQFRNASRPTAAPTLAYGRHFTPNKTFGYQRRLEALTREFANRDSVNPEEADDGLDHDDDDAELIMRLDYDRADAERKAAKARAVAAAAEPVLPARCLPPALEAIAKRRAEERRRAEGGPAPTIDSPNRRQSQPQVLSAADSAEPGAGAGRNQRRGGGAQVAFIMASNSSKCTVM